MSECKKKKVGLRRGALTPVIYRDDDGRVREGIQVYVSKGQKFVSTLDGTLIPLECLMCIVSNALEGAMTEYLLSGTYECESECDGNEEEEDEDDFLK